MKRLTIEVDLETIYSKDLMDITVDEILEKIVSVRRVIEANVTKEQPLHECEGERRT